MVLHQLKTYDDVVIAPLTYNVAVLVVYVVVCGCYLWWNRNMLVYHCVHIY